MTIYQPTVNSGLYSGDCPLIWNACFNGSMGFLTSQDCDKWIDAHQEDFTMNELSGCVVPTAFEIKEPILLTPEGKAITDQEYPPFMATFDKVKESLENLNMDCVLWLHQFLHDHNNSVEIDPEDDEWPCITYDGGNHPEYAATPYSGINRIFLKENNHIYFDIEDCSEYDIDLVEPLDLAYVCEYLYTHSLKKS